jgi:hypothetical protein
MHAGLILQVRISLTIILILIGIISISWVRHKRRLMIFFTPCFDMNFLADNASFDSTFDHHPREHDTFEEHPCALSYFGRLETPETYLDHLDHGDSIQNIAREPHHAPCGVNNILPSDFDRNPVVSGVNLEPVASYPPGSQLLSTSPPESLIYLGNVPYVSQESSSPPGDIAPNSNACSPTESSSADFAGDIQCTLPTCEKMFTSITTYK